MPPTKTNVPAPVIEVPTGIFRGHRVMPARRCTRQDGTTFSIVDVLGTIDGYSDAVRVSVSPSELAAHIQGSEIVGTFVPNEKSPRYQHPETGAVVYQGRLAPTAKSFAARVAAIVAAADSTPDAE